MKRFFSYTCLFLGLLLAAQIAYGQEKVDRIKGSMDAPLSGAIIHLELYQGFNFFPVAMTSPDEKLKILFESDEGFPQGLYRVRMEGMEMNQIFYLGSEGAEIKAKVGESGQMPKFEVESAEQDRYGKLQFALMDLEKQIANLKMQMNSIDYFDPKFYTISDSLERELDKVIADKNEDMLEFSEAYRGTFTGDILAKLYMEPSRPEGDAFETHRSYESRHYLDYVPWGDNRVYNSRMLSEKVFNLLANLTTFSEVALVNRVNEVMNASIAADGSEIMTAGILSYVLMFNNGPQNVFEVAARPYFSDCTSGGPFDEICSRIAQIDRAANGIFIPSINVETTDGGNISLRNNASSAYLLAMWSPDCPKCLKALPDMFSFEDEMGIPVRMVALGGESEIVNKLFESYDHKGVSGILKEGWKDPLITELQITSTPEYMLVNNQHEVISRWYNLQELKEYLSSSQQ